MMARFFPEPYENELIFYVYMRYAFALGYCYKEMRKDLCMKEKSLGKISPLLGGQLNILYRGMPEDYKYTMDDLIEQHTILPFCRPFVSSKNYLTIKNGIKYNIPQAVNVIKSSYDAGLKYCKKCVEEDKKSMGEAYLHKGVEQVVKKVEELGYKMMTPIVESKSLAGF